MSPRMQSLIWNFYTKLDSEHATCNFCKQELVGTSWNLKKVQEAEKEMGLWRLFLFVVYI